MSRLAVEQFHRRFVHARVTGGDDAAAVLRRLAVPGGDDAAGDPRVHEAAMKLLNS